MDNTLPAWLMSVAKLFTDDTSLYSVVYDFKTTSVSLKEDLVKINQWTYQWTTLFVPNTSKQVQEMAFPPPKIL